MKYSKNSKQDLILKHLKKETSEFEEHLLSEWLEESAENRVLFEETSRVWNLTEKPKKQFEPDVEKAWQKVKMMANLDPNAAAQPSQTKIVSIWNQGLFLKVAASILLFLGLGWGILGVLKKDSQMITISTGEYKRKIVLPDSSTVWLNKNSSVVYADNFAEGEREIQLKGEAFFEVKKDQGKSFTVLGYTSKTVVLGTSFNVRALATKKEEVEVYTGKVSFARKENPKEIVLVTPGFKAQIAQGGGIVKEKAENTNTLSWKNEQLVFSNAKLKEVVEALGNHLEVPIELQNKELLNCRFTGTFEKPTLQEAMEILSASMGLTYKQQGEKYILIGQSCP